MDDADGGLAGGVTEPEHRLARALNATGLAILGAAVERDGSGAVSPLSIGLALGMARAGATGPVATALDRLLPVPLDEAARLRAFAALTARIASDPASAAEEDPHWAPPSPTVVIANRLVTDLGFEPLPAYVADVARWFDGSVASVPLHSDGPAAADRINGWIEDVTRGLLRTVVEAPFPDDLVAMIVNAVYLKARWSHPFDRHQTSDAAFTLLDGTRVAAPTMHGWADGRFGRLDGLTAGSLDYEGDSLEMVILLPDEGHFDAVAGALSTDVLDSVDAALASAALDVTLPQFTTETRVELADVIEHELGITGLFGVTGLDRIGPELALGEILHATRVTVDEEGTEAAAATIVAIALTGLPLEPPVRHSLHVDRPFLYLIRDRATGAILFAGRVTDPR
ncbi:serpin family protein [Demequina sp.]|uniref:serpin family protein n=1 Tax=Demequina sp. TaxID=2050685 RepID=UPI0025CF2559|nr:serpin family protein [Demequina sp.]